MSNNQLTNSSFKLWRNILLGNVFIGYCMYYLTRKACLNSISMLQEDPELSFNNEIFGIMASSQMAFYSIGKIASGVLSDRVSPKMIFTVGLLVVGVVNVCFGFSTSATTFIVLQACNGFFQGCGWAPIAILVKRWYRSTELGTIWAVLSSSMNISSSVIPLAMASLSDHVHWRTCFVIVGLVPCIFSLIAFTLIVDDPMKVSSKFDYNSLKAYQRQDSSLNKAPFSDIFQSKFILLISLSYFLWTSVKSGLEDWLQLYLMKERKFTKYQAGFAVMYFQFGGLLACLSSGVVSDKLIFKFGDKMKTSPRLPVILFCSSFIVLWLYLLHCINCDVLVFINFVCFFLGFCCYGPHTLYGLLVMENAPRGLSGTAHALSAAASTIGSVFAGYPLTYLSNAHGWNGVFVAMTIVAIFNSVLLTFASTVDRRTPKLKPE